MMKSVELSPEIILGYSYDVKLLDPEISLGQRQKGLEIEYKGFWSFAGIKKRAVHLRNLACITSHLYYIVF